MVARWVAAYSFDSRRSSDLREAGIAQVLIPVGEGRFIASASRCSSAGVPNGRKRRRPSRIFRIIASVVPPEAEASVIVSPMRNGDRVPPERL
jgi:hypothetical protein